MAAATNPRIAVKIPIAWESMSSSSQQHLEQIVGRDSRAIKRLLGIIEHNEDDLLCGKRRNKVSLGQLNRITMTATRGKANRTKVPHDLKVDFPRACASDLAECVKTAVSLYNSYLALRQKRGWRASRPCKSNSSGRIPRWMFHPKSFRLVQHENTTARWWMSLRDSMDSNLEDRLRHDRLMIPLKMSPFHENQLQRGEVKAAQVFTDRLGKWWVTISVRLAETPEVSDENPPAVLGIDLGIEKAVCTTLVTPEKVRETRYFTQQKKVRLLKQYDDRVASLQSEMDLKKARGQRYDGVAERLRSLRTKRESVSKEHDRVLLRELIDYILELSERYTLFVAIGRLKNIRNSAKRGDWKGRRFRGMVHSWAFARITEGLRRQLGQLGWPVLGKKSRVHAVPEAWTSIICWKCGQRGTRPRQNLFVCSCGNKCNADKNGAINIAGRLITLTESLNSVRGLGKWASAASARRTQLKARRKTSSKGRSSLSGRDASSHRGESAAVHYAQPSLLDFGDEAEVSDDGPAVGRNVERLSTAGTDEPAEKVGEGSQDRKRSATSMMPDKDSIPPRRQTGNGGNTGWRKGGTRKSTREAHSLIKGAATPLRMNRRREAWMVRPPGIEPGPHAWKAWILTTRLWPLHRELTAHSRFKAIAVAPRVDSPGSGRWILALEVRHSFRPCIWLKVIRRPVHHVEQNNRYLEEKQTRGAR